MMSGTCSVTHGGGGARQRISNHVVVWETRPLLHARRCTGVYYAILPSHLCTSGSDVLWIDMDIKGHSDFHGRGLVH